MRISACFSLGVLGAFALAVAGCNGGYAVGGSYQSGGYVAPPPQPVVVAPQPAVVAPPPGGVAVAAEASVPVAGAEVDVAMFYDSLAPYGRWVVVPQYGRCFIPANVAVGWRPYTLGRWEYTDYGWTWVSDEPFGWATCHYGGWQIVAGYGWLWVPGTHWGPAWVSWREGGGYCGWAPLPPHHGVDISVSFTAGIPADHYTFVDERYVTAPEVHTHVVNVRQNTTIINKTTNITNIKVVNNKVVNQSLNVRKVEQVTGKRVQTKVIRTTDRPTKGAVRGNEVEIYHPKVTPRKTETRTPARETVTPKNETRRETVTPRTENRTRETVTPRTENRVTPAVKTNPQYEAERAKLNQQHAAQLKALEEKQAKERANRGNVTAAELQKRHEAERAKLEAQHKREQADLRKKHNVTENPK